MNTNWKKQVVLLLLVVVIAGLMTVMAGGAAAQEEPPLGPPNPPVMPRNSNAFGKTYDEWAVAFWQWAGRVEAAYGDHPLVAQGAIDCSLGQEGKVWFLGGIYGGSGLGDRTCEVPVGKALFFPVVNIICSPLAYDPDDPEFLLACAANPGEAYGGFDVQLYPVSATIDGREIPNLEEYYILSEETFSIGPLPDPNLFGFPEGTEANAATSGYYLLLPPLSEGLHTIQFVGVIAVDDYPFTTDFTYYLEVTDE